MLHSNRFSNTHAIIIAGGLGTRSENPSVPKILQKIDKRTLLEYQLDALTANQIKKATFLLGFGAKEVENEIRHLTKVFPEIEVKIKVDGQGDNQVTALRKALMENLHQDEIGVVILGDVLWCDDIGEDIRALIASESLALVLVHPNLHPNESDIFYMGAECSFAKLVAKQEARVGFQSPTRALTGVFCVKQDSHLYFSNQGDDLLQALIRPLFRANKLLIRNTSGYFQDTGTASRLLKAKKDLQSGNLMRRSSQNKIGIFLDRDGTLVFDVGFPRKNIASSEILEPVGQAIARSNSMGVPVFMVTNQPGIAKGRISHEDFLYTQAQIESLLAGHNAIIDDFDYCPHYPHAGFPDEVSGLKIVCTCRKPAPGMIVNLAKKHRIDLLSSILIGDSLADKRVAESLAMNFRKCSYTGEYSSNTADIINSFLDGLSK